MITQAVKITDRQLSNAIERAVNAHPDIKSREAYTADRVLELYDVYPKNQTIAYYRTNLPAVVVSGPGKVLCCGSFTATDEASEQALLETAMECLALADALPQFKKDRHEAVQDERRQAVLRELGVHYPLGAAPPSTTRAIDMILELRAEVEAS